MINNCKGVIFDFNGTLFWDSDKHILAWGKMAKQLRGYDTTSEELQAHFFGVPNNKAIEYIFQKECDVAKLNMYSEMKESYYREFCMADPEKLHLIDGAPELFDILKKEKIPFTIASASIKSNIDFYVKTFGLEQWFDETKIIYDNGSYANKKNMFLSAANAIGIPIEECIVFEDSESGIRDAYEVGCKNIVVIDSMGVAEEKYAGKPGIIAIVKEMTVLDKTWFEK